MDRPQESGPGLVVEGDDDWRKGVRSLERPTVCTCGGWEESRVSVFLFTVRV